MKAVPPSPLLRVLGLRPVPLVRSATCFVSGTLISSKGLERSLFAKLRRSEVQRPYRGVTRADVGLRELMPPQEALETTHR